MGPTSPASGVPAQPTPSKLHCPIQVLSTPAAQAYSHLHPVLILSVFAVRFRALVDDPQSALLSTLPVVAALQVAYVVLCLPPAGRSSQLTKGSSGPAARSSKKRSEAGSANVVSAILSLSLPILLGTPLLASLLVLFGAPLTTHLPHTLLCAAHMAVLAGTSLVYVHGTEPSAWRQIWSATRAVDTVWAAVLGTCVGAWLGAVPIPLDWDRPWQAYPVTIITGAYIGYALGCSAGRTPFFYGKSVHFTSPEAENEQSQQASSGKQ